jgi:hypothetical protein
MSEAISRAPNSPIVPVLIGTDDDLTERLRADAEFDVRWASWQSRGRSHERAFQRRLFMLIPVAAVAATIVGLLLVR